MTFTEAAVEVLRREGKPLHFKKIAEIAIRESLLDHVGKVPEETMGGQLAAHCRLPHTDRRIVAVQPATFALVEWGLDEDPRALDNMIERPAEEEPLRPRERHPIPSREMARSVGRGEPRFRRREEGAERRGRRFPPPAEVAYEILAGAERPMSLAELGALGAERLLMPDAFVRDTASLAAALEEDNRRREAAGRRTLFGIDGETVSLVDQPEPGERPAISVPAVRAAADVRRSALASLRRRIRECGGPAVEYLAARFLERMGLRDVKVAKRGRDQVVYTGRKKLGLGDIRHCARVLRGGADVGRREVQEVRRDLGHYGAQMGILITPGDAMREARSEALAAGQLPVILLCGEALAEAFAEVGLGCQPVVIPELDESFFRQAIETAEREDTARRARREERERERERDRERAPSAESVPAALEGEVAEAPSVVAPPPAVAGGPEVPGYPPEPAGAPAVAVADESEDEDEEEGEEGEGETVPSGVATPQSEGEARRRRRRRRRRGGRGRSRERPAAAASETAPTAPGQGPATPSAVAEVPSAPDSPAVTSEPMPGGGGGGGEGGAI